MLDKLPDEVVTDNNYTALKDRIVELYTKPQPQQFNDLLHCNVLVNKTHSLPPTTSNPCVKFQPARRLLEDTIIHQRNAPSSQNKFGYNSRYIDAIQLQHAQLLVQLTYSIFTTRHTSFHVRSGRMNTNYTSTQQRQQRPGSNFNHNFVPQNVPAFNDQQKPQVCRYHLYYGKSAKRCRRWCMLNNPNVPTYPDSRPTSRSSSSALRNNPEN